MLQYVCIYLVGCSAKHEVTVQIMEQLSRETCPEHYQTFKIGRFAKRIMPECRRAVKIFHGKEGFCGTRVFR